MVQRIPGGPQGSIQAGTGEHDDRRGRSASVSVLMDLWIALLVGVDSWSRHSVLHFLSWVETPLVCSC